MDRESSSNLVHLLRNPLNALSLHLQIARRRIQELEGEQAVAAQSALDVAQYELERVCHVLNLLAPDQRTTAAALPEHEPDE